jgi:hypothetical protein
MIRATEGTASAPQKACLGRASDPMSGYEARTLRP